MRDLRFSQCHIPEYSGLQEGDSVPLCGYKTSQKTPIFIPQTYCHSTNTVRCLRWCNVRNFRERLSAGSKAEMGCEEGTRKHIRPHNTAL
jgi:hypothetical protein